MVSSAAATSANGRDSVDVVVVGGGPAGLSAAKILARSRRSVLVIDVGTPRNGPAAGVHNYLYAEGTPPLQLAATGRSEARAYGVEVVEGTALTATVLTGLEPAGPRFTVAVRPGDGARRTIRTRRVVLATGLVDLLPEVAGLAARWGKDILHCPFCHGWEVRDQAVGVLGTSPMALHQVMLFRQLTDDVVYFQHNAPDPTDEQVEQLTALGIRWVVGKVATVLTDDDRLTGVQMEDGRVVPRQALAVGPTVEARQDLLAELGLTVTDLVVGGVLAGHYLPADPTGLTATAGVWAAGNVTAPMAQVVTAAAAGSGVGAAVHMDLMVEDTRVAVDALRARQGAGQAQSSSSAGSSTRVRVVPAGTGAVRAGVVS